MSVGPAGFCVFYTYLDYLYQILIVIRRLNAFLRLFECQPIILLFRHFLLIRDDSLIFDQIQCLLFLADYI